MGACGGRVAECGPMPPEPVHHALGVADRKHTSTWALQFRAWDWVGLTKAVNLGSSVGVAQRVVM